MRGYNAFMGVAPKATPSSITTSLYSMSTPAGDPRSPSDDHRALLKPGSLAPHFTLRSTPDQSISLTDFRGRPVILAFYPADWSPVCGDQMTLYNEVLEEFRHFKLNSLAYRSTARGVMQLTPGRISCTFRFWPISNQKERSRALTVFMMEKKARANALYSLSILMGLFTGAMSPQSVSIPEPTEFCPRSKS